MRNFIIAIKKKDPDYWLELADRFPVEAEDVKNFYIFTTEAEDLPHAVRIAKLERGIREAKSNYEPEEETLE